MNSSLPTEPVKTAAKPSAGAIAAACALMPREARIYLHPKGYADSTIRQIRSAIETAARTIDGETGLSSLLPILSHALDILDAHANLAGPENGTVRNESRIAADALRAILDRHSIVLPVITKPLGHPDFPA